MTARGQADHGQFIAHGMRQDLVSARPAPMLLAWRCSLGAVWTARRCVPSPTLRPGHSAGSLFFPKLAQVSASLTKPCFDGHIELRHTAGNNPHKKERAVCEIQSLHLGLRPWRFRAALARQPNVRLRALRPGLLLQGLPAAIHLSGLSSAALLARSRAGFRACRPVAKGVAAVLTAHRVSSDATPVHRSGVFRFAADRAQGAGRPGAEGKEPPCSRRY